MADKSGKRSFDGSSLARKSTIYDAVAGRLSTRRGFISASNYGNTQFVDATVSHVRAANTHRALFRLSQKPRVAHSWQRLSSANTLPEVPRVAQPKPLSSWVEDLPEDVELPDGELIKSIHTYASDYYQQTSDTGVMYGALDETALIALGILLEEIARENIGKHGDLAFLESQAEDDQDVLKRWNGYRFVPHHISDGDDSSDGEDVNISQMESRLPDTSDVGETETSDKSSDSETSPSIAVKEE